MNQAELGAALRALRQASGKEAKAVARSAVMSTAKLSKIENGRVAPATADVERILTALDVSPEIKAEYLAVARAQATEATAWRLFRRMGYHKKRARGRVMPRAVLRYVTHRITQHPDTDVTFEAECLRCGWSATPSEDGSAVDIECMGHTGRTGHEGFRRVCTSFALVVRAG
ncbi:helix-turn-helix domain-containing protein [Streptomyces genisteinicus]|uniref:Helix-turn-helix domain-containing protein n=1 Tax=Streptomyces genisteinicus TaxID=2768068 RepID=A0A7H0HX35_9ACTN|nr:helix-turn-helix domain-containing protein [Streptomyces genisteinicus]